MINFADHIWGLLQEFDFYQFWWNKAIHAGRAAEDDRRARRPGRGVHDVRRRRQSDPGGLHPLDALQRTIYHVRNAPSCGAASATTSTTGSGRSTCRRTHSFLEWFLKYVDLLGGRDKSDAFEAAIPKVYGDIFQSGKVAFAQEGEWMPAELKAAGDRPRLRDHPNADGGGGAARHGDRRRRQPLPAADQRAAPGGGGASSSTWARRTVRPELVHPELEHPADEGRRRGSVVPEQLRRSSSRSSTRWQPITWSRRSSHRTADLRSECCPP